MAITLSCPRALFHMWRRSALSASEPSLLDTEATLQIQHWLFNVPYAQPIIRTEYSTHKPEHRTPVEGLYLETMTQIYPEDRGQNYSIKMGKQVAKTVVEDHAKREPKLTAAV